MPLGCPAGARAEFPGGGKRIGVLARNPAHGQKPVFSLILFLRVLSGQVCRGLRRVAMHLENFCMPL